MLKEELRQTHFPYCLIQQEDGSYVITNRNYKPLGFMVGGYVQYEEFPVGVKLKGLTPKLAAELDARGRDNLQRIYLYNDGCVPTASEHDMQAYLRRLARLMALQIAD